jgi:uncharacterized protein (TIGR04255 family)
MKRTHEFRIDLTETFPHLSAAPIVEAVIHWVARAGKAFSSDDLKKNLTERFSNYPECQPQHELQFETNFAADGSATEAHREKWHGYRLTSLDKRRIVQFTRDGIAFSRLTPYENWEVFSAEALRVWKIFVEFAEPSEVQRLGVRFINRITPIKLADVGRYLSTPPKRARRLGMPMNSFLLQSAHDVPGHPFRINVVETIQPPAPLGTDDYGLVVDIDVYTTQEFAVADELMLDYLTKMHWLKNKTFFSLMSKKAILRFEKDQK